MPVLRRSVVACMLLCAAAGAASCGSAGDDSSGQACSPDRPCPADQACVDGRCVSQDRDADADLPPDGGDGDAADDGDGDADGDGGGDAADDAEPEAPDPYVDTDDDTIADMHEGTGDADGDTIPNHLDLDSDGDDIPDEVEAGDSDPRTPPLDSDRDGVPDFLDTDSDNDTILDYDEWLLDPDGDGVPAYRDWDSDGDGIGDREEAGDLDPSTSPIDTDGDTTPDFLDLDSDDDTISDAEETIADTDGDGFPDYLDLDSDGDGIPDADEAGDADLSTPARNCDGDALPDFRDTDSDNDGIGDRDEPAHGTDPCNPDTDGDGVSDLVEITYGSDPLRSEDSPRTRGDFVFVVEYSEPPAPPIPPDPLRDTLSFSTALQRVDVYVAIDTSGSMGGEIANLTAGFRATIVPQIAARIPEVQFGVGRFEDCPSSTCYNSMNNLQDITSSITLVENALRSITTTCGGSEPYRQMLWLLATGNTGVFSGNVRPRPRRCTDPLTVGWPCFRPDAVKIIIQCGDEPMSQSNSCSPARTHADVVAAMTAQQIRYIGIESGNATLRTDMQAVGRDTGSVDGRTGSPFVFTIPSDGSGLSTTIVDAVDQLARNVPIRVDAVPRDEPSDAVDAVVEFIDYLETNTSGRTVMGRVCTTGLTTADGNGDGRPDYFPRIFPGTSVCWDIVPKSNVTVPPRPEPQIFVAHIDVIGDLFTPLDTRRVFFLVPPVIQGAQ